MRCDEARALLWPPENPRLASPEVLEAREHVQECEACMEYFAQSRSLLDFYRRASRRPAPPAVRERVFDALARERLAHQAPAPGTAPRRLWSPQAILAAAAVVTLLAVPASLVLFNSAPDEPTRGLVQPATATGSAFVEDFLRRAVQEEHIRTSDPAEVQRFLQRELGLPVEVLNVDSFSLGGAEVCIVEGIRGAVVLYKRDGRVLYHYVIPGDRRAPPRAPRIVTDVPAVDGIIPLSSPSVVTWSQAGMEQALVSDLSSDDLLALALKITTLE